MATMKRNGMMVIKEEGKNLYGGFQGVVATLDPNTILENEKKIYLKKVQFDEITERYKASFIDEIIFRNSISACELKEKIIKLLENHPVTIELGLPEIAITSDLENLLSC